MKLVWQILNQGKNWTTIYSWVFLSEIEKTGVKQLCRILNLEKKNWANIMHTSLFENLLINL